MVGPVGESINTSLQAVYGTGASSSFSIDGDRFQATTTFKLGNKSSLIESDKPFYVNWTVTPERWSNLQKLIGALPWNITQPNPVNLTLSSYSLPWNGYPQLVGGINLNGLHTEDVTTGQKLDFELLTLAFQSPDIAKSVVFKLDTKELVAKGQSPSQMTLKGELTDLHTTSGWMNPTSLGNGYCTCGSTSKFGELNALSPTTCVDQCAPAWSYW